VSFQSLVTGERGVVRAVPASVQGLLALKRRVEPGIAGTAADAAPPRGDAELDTLPARAAEILEVAESGLRGGNKQDVVRIDGMKEPGVPREHAVAPASSRVPGTRDDLVQRRVARERVREPAGRIRVGAPELDGRGRAAAFAVARVEIHVACRAEGDA